MNIQYIGRYNILYKLYLNLFKFNRVHSSRNIQSYDHNNAYILYIYSIYGLGNIARRANFSKTPLLEEGGE